MPTTQEITRIVNDPATSDDQKAEALGISVEEYRSRNAEGYYRPLPETKSALNDPTLTDQDKAGLLGISADEVRAKMANLEHVRSDMQRDPRAPALDQLHRPTDRATPMPTGTGDAINAATVRNIINDTTLTDDQKAERLGIPTTAYRDNMDAIAADPEVKLNTLRAASRAQIDQANALTAAKVDPDRPTFDAGGDPRRQHQLLIEAEAKKLATNTGKTPDGRRAFSPEEQQAYNQYGGPVPARNIWDWAEKIEAGLIPLTPEEKTVYDTRRKQSAAEYKRQNA